MMGPMPSSSCQPPVGSLPTSDLLLTLHHPWLRLTETLFERQRSDADEIQSVLIAGGSTGAFDNGQTAS
jgi:hypothetical protein